MPGAGLGEDLGKVGKVAKEAAKDVRDGAELVATGGTSVAAWWRVIKRWLGRIIKAFLALALIFIQIMAAATSNAQACGAGGGEGSDQLPGYATTNTGSVDMNVAKIAYESVKERYGAHPDGNRVLLATFEAALAESNMRNLEGGHLDSVGVMQQRNSWGTFAQRTNPKWAINKFLTELEKVRQQHINYPAHQLAQAVQRSWCTANPPPGSEGDCHGIMGGNYKDEEARATALIESLGGFFEPSVINQPENRNDLNPEANSNNTVDPLATGACSYGGSGALLAGQKNVTVHSPGHGNFTLDVIPAGDRGGAITAGMTQLGVTYVYGGNVWRAPKDAAEKAEATKKLNPVAPPSVGTVGALDCSSFVKGAIKLGANIDIPRVAAPQYAALKEKYPNPGMKLNLSKMLPGDLIFYSYGGASSIDHVTMYLGMGTVGNSNKKVHLMLAAPSTGDVVKIQPVYESKNMFGGDPGYKKTFNANDPEANKPENQPNYVSTNNSNTATRNPNTNAGTNTRTDNRAAA